MPRFIIKNKDKLHHLASITVEHDGSIILNFVRKGNSESRFVWSDDGSGPSSLEIRHSAQTKTKDITIHSSGRVNYKYDGRICFIPCLLDLESQIQIVIYSIPSIDKLDEISTLRKDDFICEFSEEQNRRLNFTFNVIPAVLPVQPDEQGRFGIEGLYALSWSVHIGNVGVVRDELPEEVFTTIRPSTGLPSQAISEEVAYLRFRKAMYANDVILAVENAVNRDEITLEHIEAMIQAGPGVYPPNTNGVWTLVTSVPMRVAPSLQIEFKDKRYQAEIIELRQGDTRLSTVRVRFKVFDLVDKKYIKEYVEYEKYFLDAEIY